MADFQDVLSDYDEFWRFSNNAWSPYLAEAQMDLRAYNGDTWTWQEKDYLTKQNRSILELNQIRPAINFFDGYFRDTMTSVTVAPVESSDQKTADQLGEVLLYTYDKGDADHKISEAVSHSFKVGMSLCGIYMDYADDPINGDIKFFWKPYNSFLLDPFFKSRDLSDCQQALLRDYVTRDEAKVLLPFISPGEIDTLPSNTRDAKFLSLPERNKFFDNSNLLTYDQYYRRTSREVELLVDLESGQTKELPQDEDARERLLQLVEFNPRVDIIKRNKPTIELNIVLSGVVVYSGPDPTKLDDFPFVSFMTYYDPDMDDFSIKLQGITRGMRDAQREFNKRNSKFIDIMDKTLYSGWLYKPSKLVDQEAVFQTGQGSNIPLKNDAQIGTDIQPIPSPPLPPGILEYQKVLDNLLPELAGVNQDMLGTSEGGNNLVSGALAQIRASNGLRSNRSVFDNMEYSQKKLAERVLEAIQKNYGSLKVQRIINEQPTQQFYDQSFDKYDAQIIQTVKSQNQKQQFYIDLLQARELGIDIPDDLIIEAMPMQNKGELLERIQQMQQQKAEQAAQQEEERQRAARLADSMTEEKVALAQERRARIRSDLALSAERISEAEENRASAALDRAKTLTEIEGLNTDNFLKLIGFVNALEQQEINDRDRVAREVTLGTEAVKSESGIGTPLLQQQQVSELADVGAISGNNNI